MPTDKPTVRVVYHDPGEKRAKVVEGRTAFETSDWIHVERLPADPRPDRVVEVSKRNVDKIQRFGNPQVPPLAVSWEEKAAKLRRQAPGANDECDAHLLRAQADVLEECAASLRAIAGGA